MRSFRKLARVAAVSVLVGGTGMILSGASAAASVRLDTSSATLQCGIAQAAFCATFRGPTNNPPNSRAGQLDGVLWGTSVVTGSAGNPLASVPPGAINDGSQEAACNSGALVDYPQNILVCDRAAQETTNDASEVSSLAMYPRQPFNFAGRTGTIAFEVSDNSQGSHAAWPELWVTDQPVPDPFTHEASWEALPRNGFGLRFNGCTDDTGAQATCSQGEGAVGVQSAITVKNYVENDSANGGSLQVDGYGSVLEPTAPGQMNYFQVQVSQSQISVFGTDAFTGAWDPTTDPLMLISVIPNADLSFTQGLVWLEDDHYNGDKYGDQRLNTFTWKRLGFDGPVLPRDLGFDVADNDTPVTNINDTGLSGLDTAYVVQPNDSITLTVPKVTGVEDASGCLLEYNFYLENDAGAPATLQASVNGHDVSEPWPYPVGEFIPGSPETIAIQVPLSDVADGTTTVTFTSGDYVLDVMNIDLIMQGAGGIVDP